MNDLTAICIVYNTRLLFKKAYESVRDFHPRLKMLIIDGSDTGDPCFNYVGSLFSKRNKIIQLGYNIGHGNGMHYALQHVETSKALIFDSDIEMLRSPVYEMIHLLGEDKYGVGCLFEIGRDGFDYGTYKEHFAYKPVKYLHPYFMLLNVKEYLKYAPFVHHGAPCYKAMIDLHDRGVADRLLTHCDALTGHSRSEGINWRAVRPTHIKHDFGGTRNNNKIHGKTEILGTWVR